jgi:predicted NAD/FAD-binding protein
MLADADAAERLLLGGRYQPNRAVLHTDPRLMPRLRKVWSSWNYLSDGKADPAVSVTYLLNKLQPLPFRTPVFVSLNPIIEPDPATVIAEFEYSHPIFDAGMIEAQKQLPQVQGRRRVWLAGAWTGYGFHEDGLKSGLAVAGALAALANRPQRLAA